MTIQGEKKLEHMEEKENYHVMERRYGSFQRSLRIPETVDEKKSKLASTRAIESHPPQTGRGSKRTAQDRDQEKLAR
jgi:hypothetical protein